MKKCALFLCAAGMISSLFAGEVTTNAGVAVQIRRDADTATDKILNGGFTRAELKAAGNNDAGVSGLVHLRFQSTFGSGPALTLRQAYFSLPVAMLEMMAGRWYEKYTPGAYFGRYLFGVSANGSGSMCTNYTVLDGVRLAALLHEATKSSLNIGFLPQDGNLDYAGLMILASTTPIEGFKLNVGTDLGVITPENVDGVYRLAVTAAYVVMKDLMPFIEYGITDLSEAGDNSWILAGLDIPTAEILDQLRAEIEFKADRLGADTDGDLAWMIIITKKAFGLKFNLNVGADPKGLESAGPADVGFYFRTTAAF